MIKVKSRLTGGGHINRELWDNESTSSPTAQTASVLMVAALAAQAKHQVKTFDFTAAYLNATMSNDNEGDPVIMRIDPQIAELACQVDPEWRKYLTPKGHILVRVEKALYGFAPSGKLWFDVLSDALCKFGFAPNPEEPCVFNANIDDQSITVALHVDDMLVTASAVAPIDKLEAYLRGKFDGLTVVSGKELEFIGMLFDFSAPGKVAVSAPGLIHSLTLKVKGVSPTPADDNLFKIDATSPRLASDDATVFHSNVAALLWVAKRVRPDVLLAVSFLTTRVLTPTEEDLAKLVRLLKYINGTKEYHIILEPDKIVKVTAFVDAAYAPHADAKSQGGMMISLGKGPVFVRSSKSKIVVKSSTEAEFVTLSDSSGEIIWTRNFLIGQGIQVGPVETFQDNKSTIILAERGKNHSPRTKHIAVRYFFIKDRIEAGDLRLKYLPMAEMIADILTKPLQGEQFRTLRDKLLNMSNIVAK